MALLFVASSQVLRQELFSRREKLEAVLRFSETMSFIGEKHVLIRDALALHGFDDLFGFGLFHAWVVRALPDKDGNLDLDDFKKRRARFQKFFLGFRIAHALVEDGDDGLPVLRDAVNQRNEIAGADNVYRAAEEVGSEGCANQCSIATIGTAENGYFLRIGDALLHGPVDGIYQVIVHLTAPFFIARVHELFAIDRRAALIDLQTGVAAIGEPLRVGTIAPTISGPGTAMHIQHHWQVAPIAPGRQREIAVNGPSIPGGEDNRLQRGKGSVV